MKSDIETLERILSLASNNFNKLKASSHKNGGYSVKINVVNYSESLFLVSDIIKMCMLTLEAEEPVHYSSVMKQNINISSVLEVALQFLPLEEAEVLDELQVLLKNRKNE